MSYLSTFDTPENRKRKWDASIYEISERVTAFFWDDAPPTRRGRTVFWRGGWGGRLQS